MEFTVFWLAGRVRKDGISCGVCSPRKEGV
jgi:hypothetical protein